VCHPPRGPGKTWQRIRAGRLSRRQSSHAGRFALSSPYQGWGLRW
jgi:hypothetical protein